MSSSSVPAWVPRLGAAGSAVLAALVIATLVLHPFAGVRPVYAHDNFTLTAESSDRLGVAPDSAFLLESKDPVRLDDVKKELTVKNAPEPKLEQVSDKQIRIAFAQPLAEKAVVAFRLDAQAKNADGTVSPRPYGWAFQTRESFRVVSTLPGDRQTDVPTNSGIEFTFSHDVDLADVQAAFSIEPKVDGKFEQHQRVVSFIPKELVPFSTYTVKLASSVHAKGSALALAADQTFTFETGKDGKGGAFFRVNRSNLFFRPDEAPFVPVNAYFPDDWERNRKPMSVDVDVRRIPDVDAYAAALKKDADLSWRTHAKADDIAPVASLPSAATFSTQTLQGDPFGGMYISFPSPLPAGYYIATVQLKDSDLRTWALFQSTDVSTYVSPAINGTLVWVNDTSTHKPIADADIDLVGAAGSARTDARGLATVVPESDGATYVRVRAKGQTLLLSASAPKPSTPQDYRSYVYTDRPLYQPGDDVRFWGYAARLSDGRHPATVHVAVDPYVSLDVKPDASGFFNGTVSTKQIPSSYYVQLSFTDVDAGVAFANRSVTLQEYTKPLYFLTVTPDVDAAFAGDRVGYTVHGEFFDGTPMKGLPVHVTASGGPEFNLTLDEAGNARGEVLETSGFMPQSQGIYVSPARPEEGQITAGGAVSVFAAHAYLDVVKSERAGNVGHVQVRARNVKAVSSWNADDFTTTPRAGLTLRATVTETTYTKTQTGQYYDFISKVSHPTYTYDRHDRVVGSTSLTTGADGLASYDVAVPNPEASYQVDFAAADEKGNAVATSASFWQGQNDGQQGGNEGLVFRNPDQQSTDSWNNASSVDVGTRVRLDIVHPDGTVLKMTPQGRALVYRGQEGIKATDIVDAPRYAFDFTEKEVPNVGVYGVYFDGQAYTAIRQPGWWYGAGYSVNLRQDGRRLTVETQTDKPAYRPGDTATVSLKVRDAKGAPVSATVNVNVVDEAFYAVQDESVNPLSALYAPIPTGVFEPLLTHEAMPFNPAASGAEKGGGGDRDSGAPRKNFKDTAQFVVVRTAADGTAQASVELPDNVTTWRVTTQAVSADGRFAGTDRHEIVANLPFFVTPVVRDRYLPQDQPTILLRGAGTDVATGTTIEYHVTIPDAKVDATLTGTAGGTARLALPSLPLGDHEITVAGAAGTRKDAVTRTIRIVPSWVTRPTMERVDLDATGKDVASASGRPSSILFVDGGTGSSVQDLWDLSWQEGARADQAATRAAAVNLLNGRFNQNISVLPMDASYQAQDGGFQLFPYGSSDPALSTRLAYLGSANVPMGMISTYFHTRLDGGALTDRETAQALSALAALGEPVLPELQAFVARTDIKPDQQDDAYIAAALGLHFMGDDEGARAIYRAFEPRLKSEDGMAYLPSGDDEARAERSADLAILAQALQMPQADALDAFLRSGIHTDAWLGLERFLSVRERLAHLPKSAEQPAEVAFSIGGQETKQTLDGWMYGTQTLHGMQNVRVTKGTAYALVTSDRPVTENEPTDPDIRLNRVYSVVGGDNKPTTSFREGDLVKVTLSYDVPKSKINGWQSFRLVDVLPSGLAPVTDPAYANQGGNANYCVSYPYDLDGQRVSFNVYPNQPYAYCPPNTVTYYARVVTPGAYAAESPVLFSNYDPSRFTYLRATTSITVKE